MTELQSIIRELFPSPEMASYLSGCPLRREQIRNAVAYAAVPLERKRDMFLELASGKDRNWFRRQAGMLQQAVREMQLKPGEFFYLRACWYYCDDENSYPVEEKALEPYLKWEHIFERMREFLDDFDDFTRELVWFEAEKWSPDREGRLVNNYDFTIWGDKVCWFWCHSHPLWFMHEFSTHCDLYLPVPFHPGDIVTVDCRPFAPVEHAVILEVGDNRDCCCLQAMFREYDGTWATGAVKHGHIFPGFYSPGISPLYRIAAFHGELPEEERLLEKVSRYLDGDEGRGAALWKSINFPGGEFKRDRKVTEEQILSYIESDMDI